MPARGRERACAAWSTWKASACGRRSPSRRPDATRSGWIELKQAPRCATYHRSRTKWPRGCRKNNPRLTDDRAAFLAPHWSAPERRGRCRKSSAIRRTGSSTRCCITSRKCWRAGRAITAPVLWVRGAQEPTCVASRMEREAGCAKSRSDRRLRHLREVRCEMMADAGHMLHHDRPAEVARLIDDFARRWAGVGKP